MGGGAEWTVQRISEIHCQSVPSCVLRVSVSVCWKQLRARVCAAMQEHAWLVGCAAVRGGSEGTFEAALDSLKILRAEKEASPSFGVTHKIPSWDFGEN